MPAINLSGVGSAARGAYGGYGVWMASSNPSGTGKNPRPGRGQPTNTDIIERTGRHYADQVLDASKGARNTIIDPAYEQKVIDDIAEIRAGGGTYIPDNRIQITRNGETRIYGFDDKHGSGIYHLWPVSGDGFINLDGSGYRILQNIVREGDPLTILQSQFAYRDPSFLQSNRATIEEAVRAWETIPGNSVDDQALSQALDNWQAATGRP